MRIPVPGSKAETVSRRLAQVILALLLMAGCMSVGRAPTDSEMAAARFEVVRSDPAQLDEFLARMPMGGDLHHHVGGAASPGMLLRFAAESDLCLPIDPAAIWRANPPPCGDGERPAADLLDDPGLRHEIERRWSMLDYASDDPAIVRTEANAHFFAIFGKIRLVTRDLARLLAAVGSMVIGVMGGEVDRESALGTLDAAAEPQGEYLLAVVPVLRSWVESSRR